MIIVEPMGGLANRMRVIASAIGLREKLNTSLVVIWNENYELNCPYGLLFENEQLFFIQRKHRKYRYLKSSNQLTFIQTILAGLVNKLIGVDCCLQESDFYNLTGGGQLPVNGITSSSKVVYIQTCQAFGAHEAVLKCFKPIRMLAEKIDQVSRQFTACTVGIHIRRTDHEKSIAQSPVELFIAKMHAELAIQPGTTFFVCTDDPETEHLIVSEFGLSVITYTKERSRISVNGMQDAVVDLFCLSKTKKIFGSYWSSYSEIAAAINSIPLEVLTQ